MTGHDLHQGKLWSSGYDGDSYLDKDLEVGCALLCEELDLLFDCRVLQVLRRGSSSKLLAHDVLVAPKRPQLYMMCDKRVSPIPKARQDEEMPPQYKHNQRGH